MTPCFDSSIFARWQKDSVLLCCQALKHLLNDLFVETTSGAVKSLSSAAARYLVVSDGQRWYAPAQPTTAADMWLLCTSLMEIFVIHMRHLAA